MKDLTQIFDGGVDRNLRRLEPVTPAVEDGNFTPDDTDQILAADRWGNSAQLNATNAELDQIVVADWAASHDCPKF